MSRGRDEQGQAVLALLVTAAVLGLGLFLVVALPYSSAADGSAKARTAADAAALAGAQAARRTLLDALQDQGWKGGWPALSAAAGNASLSAAQDYADANRAELVQHSYDVGSGRTAVRVVGDDAVEGQRPRSAAEAQVALPSCDTEALPLPPLPPPPPAPAPVGTPDPDAEPTEEPEPDIRLPDLRLRCDRGVGELVLSPNPPTLPAGSATDVVRYLLSPGQLKKFADVMDVRLVA